MTDSSKNLWGRRVVDAGKWLVAIAVLGYLIYSDRESLAALQSDLIDWPLVFGSVCLLALAVGLAFYRWYLLLVGQDLGVSLRECFRLSLIGYFFNLLLPSAVGGDAVKVVMVARGQERKAAAVWSVLMDRLVGMIGLFVFVGGVSLVVWNQLEGISELQILAVWSVGAMTLGLVGLGIGLSPWLYDMRLFVLLERTPKLGKILSEIRDSMLAYRRRVGLLMVTILLSVLSQFLTVLVLRLLSLAVVGSAAEPTLHFLVVPASLMVGTLPLTPGGVGVTELAMERFFSLTGAVGVQVLPMMLAYRACQLIIALVGVVLFMIDRRPLTSQMSRSQTAE